MYATRWPRMNWYEHHIGDWLRKCSHLSLAEEGCYRRLLDVYYSREGPLPLDMRELRRLARCHTPGDAKVLKRVLDEFFTIHPDGMHNSRADEVILRFANVSFPSATAAAGIKSRKAMARDYRSSLFAQLRDIGIVAPYNATNAQLLTLLGKPVVTVPRTATTDGTKDGMGTATGTGTAYDSHYPKGINTEETLTLAVPGPAVQAGSAAGVACRAMRAAGIADTNPGHAVLHTVLSQGATVDDLRLAAAEAAARGKGFAYALTICQNRLSRPTPDAPARALDARQTNAEALVKAWAPPLSK